MQNIKRYLNLTLVICSLVVIILAVGCGTQTETVVTTTTTLIPPSTPTAIVGVIKLGSVGSGVSVSSAGMRIQATAYGPVAGYNVAAVSKETGKTYFAEAATDSSGSFRIAGLPAGESYYLGILDSGNKLTAPVAFGTSGDSAVMAIDSGSASEVNLGDIAYDSSKGSAAPVTAPTPLLDLTTSVEVKTGEFLVPKGAKNFGKGGETEIPAGSYAGDKVDGDKDGLPNIFDADNNGDLVPDEFDGFFTKEALGIIPDFLPYVFTNLKVDYDQRDTFKTTYSQFDIAVGITASSGPKVSAAKTVASARVIAGPSWIAKATVLGGGLWNAIGYAIPSKEAGVFEVHLQGLKPVTDVNAGDTLKFEISYTDGTSVEALKMVNFVFTDIPRVTAYQIGSGGSWVTTLPSAGPLGSAATSEVGLRWTRPKDESGNEIKGGRYTWEYNAVSGGAREVEIISKDTTTEATLEGSFLLGSLSDADLSASDFMVGLCIRSLANDNAAENVRFTKGW